MKKVTVVLSVLVLVLALSLGAFAFQNEPDRFRGLKWGDPIPEGMIYAITTEEGLDYYILPENKLFIGNVKLYNIIYIFYEERFLGVWLSFPVEDNNYDLLKSICIERYGKEKRKDSKMEDYEEYTWIGEKTHITLEWLKFLGFLKIFSSEFENREAIKEAEKAEEDW